MRSIWLAVVVICGCHAEPVFEVSLGKQPFEVRDALEERARGNWTEVGAVRQVTIWRWAPTAL
jgi:hypothetical protein